jgi:hypothetical protein
MDFESLRHMPPSSPSPEAVAFEFAGAMRAPIERIVAQYVALDATDRGRVINTDFVRLLCPHYQENPTLYATAIHKTAADTSLRIFHHYLENAGRMPGANVTLFMAGGPGSGKGTALNLLFKDNHNKPKFIFDQTFSGTGAITQIHAVLDHNLAAHVLYVHRPVELATIGIVTRYLDLKNGEQRAVPLDYIADRHFNSQHTFHDLLRGWRINAQNHYDLLSLELLNNTRYIEPTLQTMREQESIDFFAQKNILYHDANETRTRTQRAYASVAFLIRDEIRRIFDPSETVAESISRVDASMVVRGSEKLAEKSSQARCLIDQLDALRSGTGGVPSERLSLLFQSVRRETGVLLTHAFQKAAADYATGAMPPDAFNAACHKQAKAIGMLWSQKFSQSIIQRP